MESSKIIYFYGEPSERVLPENLYLNNFYPSPFIDPSDNQSYSTIEHYYQSFKFINHPELLHIRDEVISAPDADSCKILARKY